MGLDILYPREIERIELAGIMLMLRTARNCPAESASYYAAGVLAKAEHTCLAARGNWPAVLSEARSLLRVDDQAARLLEAALQIRAG